MMTDDKNEADSDGDHKHYSFNDGLPTRPDVDLLMRTWPSPKVGDEFFYDTIEALLRIGQKTARFRTVCTAWRRRMLNDFNIVIEARAGTSFYVASADQISAATCGTLEFIGHKAHKHRRKLASAKPETDLQKQTIEHQARLMLIVEKDARKHRMNLLPETSTKALPDVSKSSPRRKADNET